MESVKGDVNDPEKDPCTLTSHGSYTDKDFEEHRAHSVYCTYGFHVPGTYRRRGHHGHHKHKNGSKKNGAHETNLEINIPQNTRPITPPAERVQFILGEDDHGLHVSHPLFSEMEELCVNGEDVEWRETARWVKYEEDVEEGGDRWSKPHVATISLHSLFELRSCILGGTVLLDLEASSLNQIADLILENMVNNGQLTFDIKDGVKEALLRRHRHQHERRHDRSDRSKLPLIRSLADIGRNSSKSMFGSHIPLDHSENRSLTDNLDRAGNRSSAPHIPIPVTAPIIHDWKPFTKHKWQSVSGLTSAGTNHDTGIPNSQSTSSLHGLQVNQPSLHPNSPNETPINTSSSADLQHKLNQAFMRKIPSGSEADNILVGEIDFLDKAISAFVRLSQACQLGDLTEVPVPTRFLFILLGPHSIPGRYHEVGRAMATLMSDEVFHDVAYKAKSREDLLAGVDEFLDAVTILPPGAWDPSIRIEPPTLAPSQDSRKKVDAQESKAEDSDDEEDREREMNGLKRTGRWFGGLINDVKRKYPWYLSDFKDALALQSIATVFFLYFACLTPIITFGGLLGQATGNNIATMESLMSGALCGILYGFFGGQPLTILGSTGPVLVFETIMFDFCTRYDLHYLNLRLYIGIWTAAILFLLVALDMSALVCYITRFTEENFATLISVIFIYKAIEKLLEIENTAPIDLHPDIEHNYECSCIYQNASKEILLQDKYRNETAIKSCVANNTGELFGLGCNTPNYVPDVFLLSVILFFATYITSILLKEFKTSSFFPTFIRSIISDFAVVIAIVSMTLADNYIGLATPKLFVPSEFKPTLDTRGWIVPFFHEKNSIFLVPLSVIPALLATILIFMDQQITAVIMNRKENKLVKGCGYHLDLFVLCILILLCSIFGLPWFVAATVLSMTHINSLRMESESSAPGEKPQFLGVREQRVTHILIFILCGLSVFFTPILQRIPMPVLFGVFLYMGTSSLKGSQFFDRILIILMPQKYQPDYMFLRHVPTLRVHLFTIIQVICFVMLWVIKSYKPLSIGFPLMLVVIIGVRKSLDFFFERNELKLLDDIMPEHTKRKREEEKREKAEEEKKGQLMPNASSGNVAITLANGNILKIPVDKFGTDKEKQQCAINITEQLAKSAAWKSIEQAGIKGNKDQDNGLRKRGTKKDAKTEEEQKRLSTMTEEDDEDDCGITIRIDAPTPLPPSNLPSLHNSPDDHNETSV